MAEDDVYGNKRTYEHFIDNINNLAKPIEEAPKERGKQRYYSKNKANIKHFIKLHKLFESRDTSYVRRLRLFGTLKLITFVSKKNLKDCNRDDINEILAFSHKVNVSPKKFSKLHQGFKKFIESKKGKGIDESLILEEYKKSIEGTKDFKEVSEKLPEMCFKGSFEIKKKNFENIFLVNVTSDSFSEISTDLNLLKLFKEKRLDGNSYPYVVSIHDLLVISDLLEEPGDIIDYIKQRVELNKTYEIRSEDELDFLGYFLENGNLHIMENTKGIKHPLIHGYSEIIDKWYAYRAGQINKVEKPKRKNEKKLS